MEWHISPQNEGDLYRLLYTATQQWRFFTYAESLGLPEASRLTVRGATLARDEAVDQWNHWMHRQRGREWFLVHQHHVLDEDYQDERRGIFLTAGSKLLVAHRCESALAHVAREERPILGPDDRPADWIWEEQVVLHCIMPPPRDDELKVLPINVVPTVQVFNH